MPHKPKPSAAPFEPSPTPLLPATKEANAVVRLPLGALYSDPAFSPRIGLAKGHVQELARSIRHGTDLDPIKVWKDHSTSRWIIIDGGHRVAAYRLQEAKDIPARIYTGDRNGARLEAGRDNSKTSFPWSTSECTQYAWGLVIDGAGSKRQIVQASNVSTGTVTNMRKRLAEIVGGGGEPSRNWWIDRNDRKPEGQPDDDTDALKQARVAKLKEYLHGIETRFKLNFGRRPTMEELGLANRWHLGLPRFKAMASGGYLADEDEFSTDTDMQPLPALLQDPDADF